MNEHDLGMALIVWTVRLSVAAYAFAVWRHLFCASHASAKSDTVFDKLWLTSWLLCVIHVICAFHFKHHWSHEAALQHTAQMTDDVVGIHWGGGLYINYLFLTWWGIDAVRIHFGRQQASTRIMQAVAGFMMFNATAVFGPWWWSLVAGAYLVAICGRWRQGRRLTP